MKLNEIFQLAREKEIEKEKKNYSGENIYYPPTPSQMHPPISALQVLKNTTEPYQLVYLLKSKPRTAI